MGTRVIQDVLQQLLDGQLAASVAEVREKRAALAGGENLERQDAVAAGGGEDRVGTLEAGFKGRGGEAEVGIGEAGGGVNVADLDGAPKERAASVTPRPTGP